jgi:hypothetical protein
LRERAQSSFLASPKEDCGQTGFIPGTGKVVWMCEGRETADDLVQEHMFEAGLGVILDGVAAALDRTRRTGQR